MQNTSNSFNVLNKVNLNIQTISNPFDFKMNDLFLLGARVNPKRSFLFVSKLLGKHLEVHPDIPKLSGHLLANLFTEKYGNGYFSNIHALVEAVKREKIDAAVKQELSKTIALSEKTLFLGFAETATGIGHSVFSAFDNAYYLHTTREEFSNKQSVFNFREDHSHATDHVCYLLDQSIVDEVNHIVLIDDEITTGNTCLNLIRALNEVYPNKRYTVLSLLDWRTKEQAANYEKFQNELQVEIQTLSLLRGSIELTSNHVFEQPGDNSSKKASLKGYEEMVIPFKERVSVKGMDGKDQSLLLTTGRFGVSSETGHTIEEEAKRVGELLKSHRKGEKTLCIGNGEFMYIPSRIAAYMGKGVAYKSSTRSPIYIAEEKDYPIYDRIEYEISQGTFNYLYNLEKSGFDEVIMFFEESPAQEVLMQIADEINEKGIKRIIFVIV